MSLTQLAIIAIALVIIFIGCELLKRDEDKEVLEIIHKLNKVRRLVAEMDTVYTVDNSNCKKLLSTATDIREILIQLDNELDSFFYANKLIVEQLITHRLAVINRIIELLEVVHYYNKTNNNLFVKGTSTLAIREIDRLADFNMYMYIPSDFKRKY